MAGIVNRRQMLASLGLGAVSLSLPLQAVAQAKPRIVIVGGGFGGASAAVMLKALLPLADVKLIEPNPTYTACPFSNLVIGGLRSIEAQQFGYGALSRLGISVIQSLAIDVDASARQVRMSDNTELPYDRLVLSPGIAMRWNSIEGYDEAASQVMPHAWKAAVQTTLLRQQLEAMEDGRLVVMSVPTAPYRCPPGPYERASLIAHYLKTQKPRSKLLILDAKDSFSKMPLFQEAWAELYPDHLEWVPASEDGGVRRVEPDSMTLYSDFEAIKGDVANVIPPQKTGEIAERAGVADATGWCPINPISFESSLQPSIHVIGDATIAAPMPKSAFSANLQAKICAISIARILSDLEPEPTVLANTCYSYTAPDRAVSITGVYSNEGSQLASIPGAGGLSPLAADSGIRNAEAAQAEAWFAQITKEAFG